MSKRSNEDRDTSFRSCTPSSSGVPSLPKRAKMAESGSNLAQSGIAIRDSLFDKSLGDFHYHWKQQEAFEARRDNERVFGVELGNQQHTGLNPRSYIVSTLKRFWREYSAKYVKRHFYELIQENFPCRLYFDLEFEKIEANKDLDQMTVYNHFLQTTIEVVKEFFKVDLEKKNFLTLDSSTTVKFSCHVIVHFPDGKLFPANTSLKPLVEILNYRLTSSADFKIFNSDGKQITVVDISVYSKNRLFRLFLSSKLGKDAVLKLAAYCEKYDKTPSDEKIFYDSLVIPDKYDRFSIVRMPDLQPVLDEVRKAEFMKKMEEDENEWPPIVVNNLAPKSYKEDPDAAVLGPEDNQPVAQPPIGPIRDYSNDFEERSMPSPFPEIDDFIYGILRSFNPNAHIYKYRLIKDNIFSDKYFSIVYYPLGIRYCYNIGREHKSNNTWWTVNFNNRTFFQKCFDQDCNRKSQRFQLPEWLNVPYQQNPTVPRPTLNEIQSPISINDKDKDKRKSDPANSTIDQIVNEQLAKDKETENERRKYFEAWCKYKCVNPL
ncbi:hypothetical protein WR25_12295 [Diploscapter pachys]|uniref:DNA-directed primase/polymerase protein n=1 Tax=Diploscapter pachys TaxID=2018661 RepID=A0A2A2JUZ4_9BILA|nr:hypothetical protein WR25_12295 [Diploscapter pachys]